MIFICFMGIFFMCVFPFDFYFSFLLYICNIDLKKNNYSSFNEENFS